MLKTNVITKTYSFSLRTPSGGMRESEITAESEAAARLKLFLPYGWTVEAVTEC